jgi:hypothetical protein
MKARTFMAILSRLADALILALRRLSNCAVRLYSWSAVVSALGRMK